MLQINNKAQPFLTQQFPELFEKKHKLPQNYVYQFPSKKNQRPATSNTVSRKYVLTPFMKNSIFRIKNYLFQQKSQQNELYSTQKQMTQQMRIKSAAPKMRTQFQQGNHMLFDQNDQEQSFQEFQNMMKEINNNQEEEEIEENQ